MASQIVACMEVAIVRESKEYSRYGSAVHKQVYICGDLDTSPEEFSRNFGMSWRMGGWLLLPFLQKIGEDEAQKLRHRMARELKTTFASSYSKKVSLAEALQPDAIAAYGATCDRYQILDQSEYRRLKSHARSLQPDRLIEGFWRLVTRAACLTPDRRHHYCGTTPAAFTTCSHFVVGGFQEAQEPC